MQLRINAFSLNAQVASEFQTFGITLQVDFVPTISCREVQEILLLIGHTQRCDLDDTKLRPGKIDSNITHARICWETNPNFPLVIAIQE